NSSNKDRIKDCDFVFIAVPTPSTPEGFDDSILQEVLSLVGENKTAIIKSTIKIGTTEKFQKLYPNKHIIHSPEFLTEKNAAQDTKFPPRNVIGYTEKSKDKAQAVLDILPKAKHSFLVSSREAELVKYMGNNFLFLKVIFANMMYNLASRKGLDYNLVAEIVSCDPRIGPSHLQIKHQSGHSDKLGRGAGGHCFIKDMSALVEMFKEEPISNNEDKLSLELLEKVVELNNQLLINSDKDLDLLQGVYGNVK
ncbi:MAG: UDP-glucose/GDP-mannose dehydrogenase family protein, partial [Clostridia bacterium]|nr:UDP-glucose/GDP-mannose dehydrogenase family protein [Clostridia bacterium]